jgi:hypothetical protein
VFVIHKHNINFVIGNLFVTNTYQLYVFVIHKHKLILGMLQYDSSKKTKCNILTVKNSKCDQKDAHKLSVIFKKSKQSMSLCSSYRPLDYDFMDNLPIPFTCFAANNGGNSLFSVGISSGLREPAPHPLLYGECRTGQ